MNIEEFDYHEEPNKAMNRIVPFRSQIPQDTENIARTCAAADVPLHIIRPTGFPIGDRETERAGLDYWDRLDVTFCSSLGKFTERCDGEVHSISKFANKVYSDGNYNDGKHHYFLFGHGDKGLPEELMRANPEKALRIPTNDGHARSLNLSGTVCMIVYEALHQQAFPNLGLSHTCAHDKLK